jgi:arylsulfatase A-like enzyme
MAEILQAQPGRSAVLQELAGRGAVLQEQPGLGPVLQALSSARGAPQIVPYNVVVVVLDDIGTEWFDWLGVGERFTTDANFQYVRTPFLSSLAQQGVTFQIACSEPVCGPTRAAINTGRYAHRTGVGFNMRDPTSALGTAYTDFGYFIPGTEQFLPGHLRSVKPAIATAAFGKWHMADSYSAQVDDTGSTNPPDINLTDPSRFGYQTFKGNTHNIGGSYTWWKSENGVVQPYINGAASGYNELTYPSSVNAADAGAWIAAQTGQFFCYIAFGPPHNTFSIPPFSMVSAAMQAELSARQLVAGHTFGTGSTYDNAIWLGLDGHPPPNPIPVGFDATTAFPVVWRSMMEATDEALRRVWAAVPPAQKGRTFLIVVGDNGTVRSGLPPGFSHQKRELFWGGTRVPMIVVGPSVAHSNRVASQIVHSVDIYATVCDLMGVSKPTGLDSVSFRPVLYDAVDRSNVNAVRSFSLSQNFLPVGALDPAQYIASQRQRAVFDGRWRLLNVAGTESLYDELTDPLEETDVIGSFPDEVDRLRDMMDSVTDG